MGVVLSADGAVTALLGWLPEEILGQGSSALVHPDDLASALAAWFEMTGRPGGTGLWQGRYRAADGRWRWVQTVNENRLDDPEHPVVVTDMSRVAPSRAGVEEELRAREQLLRRLADALPVGVFQIDQDRRVLFTNDRLLEIMGVAAMPSVAEQFSVVVPEDQKALAHAIDEVLADRTVDDLELRFNVETPHPEFANVRVCQLSMRALTDGSGSITGAIGCLSDVTDSVELRRELEVRASTDGTTGCLNRTAVFELLDLSLRRTRRRHGGVGVIFIDLDRFKEVNDQFGHAAGDQALRTAAERIRESLRATDRVGRIGGDEFLVICPELPSAAAVVPIATRISDALRGSIPFGDGFVQLGASMGIAWTPVGGQSPDELIARADQAMYRSKLEGAGGVVIAT